MKSSSLFIVLVTALVFGTSAFAAGPGRSQGAAAGTGMGAQGRSAGAANTSAGSANAAATKTQAQVHVPGTGLADPSLRDGAAGAAAGTPRGIHTPGTGLSTTH